MRNTQPCQVCPTPRKAPIAKLTTMTASTAVAAAGQAPSSRTAASRTRLTRGAEARAAGIDPGGGRATAGADVSGGQRGRHGAGSDIGTPGGGGTRGHGAGADAARATTLAGATSGSGDPARTRLERAERVPTVRRTGETTDHDAAGVEQEDRRGAHDGEASHEVEVLHHVHLDV